MSQHDAARLRSEIAQLEARYDGGAMPPGIYVLFVRLRDELARMERVWHRLIGRYGMPHDGSCIQVVAY